MCVIFFYVNSNPGSNGLKLIVASNRDEFYSRETLEADRWVKYPHVFGGDDPLLSNLCYSDFIYILQVLTYKPDVKVAHG